MQDWNQNTQPEKIYKSKQMVTPILSIRWNKPCHFPPVPRPVTFSAVLVRPYCRNINVSNSFVKENDTL